MNALTLWQPWAWAICYVGKDIENRTWPPPRSLVGEQLAIHAGKRIDASAADDLAEAFPALWPGRAHLVTGAVVAVATATGVTRASNSPWFGGPVGWELADVKVLVRPVARRGFQGLWDLPVTVQEQVIEQIRELQAHMGELCGTGGWGEGGPLTYPPAFFAQ